MARQSSEKRDLEVVRNEFDAVLVQAARKFQDTATRSGLDWESESLYAMQALVNNDYLAKVARENPFSLRMSMEQVAAIGLSLNPATSLAYLVPRMGKVVVDISYRGLIKVAVDTGSIKWAQVELVYSKDKFVWKGKFTPPEHVFDPFDPDRGEFRGTYCVAKTPDGDYLVDHMKAADIFHIRAKSKAYENGDGPWLDFPEEMYKKVQLKRARKTWPPTAGIRRLDEVIRYLNEDLGEGLANVIDGEARVVPPEDQVPAPPDEAIPEHTRELITEAIRRVQAKRATWSAIRDWVDGKFQGDELVWARHKIRDAEHGPAVDAA
jgi:recombination protein RecT